MPFILAGQVDLNEHEWGGAIRVPDIPWHSSGPYLNVNGEEISRGETLRHYFTAGYNLFLSPDEKHEITNELLVQIPKK